MKLFLPVWWGETTLGQKKKIYKNMEFSRKILPGWVGTREVRPPLEYHRDLPQASHKSEIGDAEWGKFVKWKKGTKSQKNLTSFCGGKFLAQLLRCRPGWKGWVACSWCSSPLPGVIPKLDPRCSKVLPKVPKLAIFPWIRHWGASLLPTPFLKQGSSISVTWS